jgi:hypothetical protein
MDDNSLLPVNTSFEPGWLGILVVFGAILLVSLCMFFWVVYIRKPSRRRRKYRRHRADDREELKAGADDIKPLVDKHHRRHRHERRPLNPTLAQTGGLPPRREPDGQTPPDAT